jgi:4-amino-4-deoxy-L-arabinose transferase-like glycosyltransferase
MLNPLADEISRTRFFWPAVTLLAGFAYLYSLGSLSIPGIGDESPYFQITRLTAQSGEWLPLKAAEGLENTKPPLLFWQGIVSTNWGNSWNTVRLRLPIVVYTFLTALLGFSLAKHISGREETGYIAALAFLGFSSTFQHGRPFLTNMPETFFMFLVFYLLLRFRNLELRWQFWLLAGLLIGIASLYRSFAVIAPIALALAWYLWWRRRWSLAETIRRDTWKPALTVVVALACFALWPLLDPEPEKIFQYFLLKENVGKFGVEHYFDGLFTGPYPVFRIWFGAVTNAGVLMFPVIYLAVASFRQRKLLVNDERALWILVFSYLVVFSLPAQRQENYILPVMPALAVLLAMQWNRIDRRWFFLFIIPLVMALVLFSVLMFAIANGEGTAGHYSWWHPLVLISGMSLVVMVFLQRQYAPYLFFAIAFFAYIGFAVVLSPFDGPLGNYKDTTLAKLNGKTVYVPSNFRSKYERHRFTIPGAEIRGYRRGDLRKIRRLLEQGEIVAIQQRSGTPLPANVVHYGSRLVLRSRLSEKELLQVLFQQRTDVLIERETIVQLKAIS